MHGGGGGVNCDPTTKLIHEPPLVMFNQETDMASIFNMYLIKLVSISYVNIQTTPPPPNTHTPEILGGWGVEESQLSLYKLNQRELFTSMSSSTMFDHVAISIIVIVL